MEEDDIARVIRKMVLLRGPGNSVAADEVARALAGHDARKWRHLLKPVREVVIRMAKQGDVVIKRKGTLADPDKLRGAYRISLPALSTSDSDEVE